MLLNVLMLLLTASLHEDVAVLLAGYFVLEHGMPLAQALFVVYIGAVANNFVIYGLGMIARRLPALRRWLIGARVERVRRQLEQHLVKTVVLCRFVPGTLSPAILGCGWLGVPFARFAVTTAITAALYIGFIAALMFTLGDAVLKRVTEGAWLFALVLAAVVLLVAARRLVLARSGAEA